MCTPLQHSILCLGTIHYTLKNLKWTGMAIPSWVRIYVIAAVLEWNLHSQIKYWYWECIGLWKKFLCDVIKYDCLMRYLLLTGKQAYGTEQHSSIQFNLVTIYIFYCVRSSLPSKCFYPFLLCNRPCHWLKFCWYDLVFAILGPAVANTRIQYKSRDPEVVNTRSYQQNTCHKHAKYMEGKG